MDHRRPHATPSIPPWRLKTGLLELTKAEGIPELCRFCFLSRATWARESPAACPSGPSETVNQGQRPVWCIRHPYRVAITPGSVPRGEGLRWHQHGWLWSSCNNCGPCHPGWCINNCYKGRWENHPRGWGWGNITRQGAAGYINWCCACRWHQPPGEEELATRLNVLLLG